MAKELSDHSYHRLHHRMTLDEHHTHHVLLIARNEHSVLPNEHSNLGLVGNLPEAD